MKKKILFIVNLEHCSPRIPGLIKYLDKDKFKPVIICPPLPKNYGKTFGPNKELFESDVKIIQVGKRSVPRLTNNSFVGKLRKLISKNDFLFSIMSYLYAQYCSVRYYPDKDYKWKNVALEKIRKLLKKEDFDLIFTSSSPVTTHIIDSQIKKEFNIPWIADFRDLWTQNHGYSYNFIRKFIERKLEKKTMKNADKIIVAAHPFEKYIKKLHKKEAITITNGFDPEYYKKSLPINNKFKIYYVGNIYHNKQKIKPFLIAIKNLIENKKIDREKTIISFYGPYLNWLQEKIVAFGLEDIIKQKGMVSRKKVYSIQKTADVLLLLNWEIPNDPHYPLKLFEYLGAKRFIISLGGEKNNVANRIIKKTNSGKFYDSIHNLKKGLKECYNEKIKKDHCTYNGKIKEIKKYSHLSTTKEFEKVFDNV